MWANLILKPEITFGAESYVFSGSMLKVGSLLRYSVCSGPGSDVVRRSTMRVS